MIILLTLIFCIVGMMSSVIGLGGGTFYLIFMDLFGLPVYIIPVLALMSNIVISGVGTTMRLIKREYFSLSFLIIILLPSMMMAYFGASIQIEYQLYRLVLNIAILFILLIRLILQKQVVEVNKDSDQESLSMSKKTCVILVFISAAVGFVSGLIGIGGGIILGPMLYIFGMSYTRIPLITTIYIFINSLVGLFAHLQKAILQNLYDISELYPYLVLPIVSIITAFFSMRFLAFKINSIQIKYMVILIISAISVFNIIKLGGLYV